MPENAVEAKSGFKLAFYFYVIVLLAGITLYLGWSILYGTWFDAGVYSICVVMIGFGILGVLLYGRK